MNIKAAGIRQNRIQSGIFGILLKLVGAVIMIYPVVWMFMGSFKSNYEIFGDTQTFFPSSWDFSKYVSGWAGFGGVSFGTFFLNSFVVAGLGTIGAVASSSVVAFGFSRCKFRGRGIWFACMLLTMMLPSQVTMIPKYIIFNQLGWVGTKLPLIVPSFTSEAFFVFLIMQFIRGIPMDLDEAAKIDGSSMARFFVSIILPLTKPAMVTAAIFSFMWKWEDFMGPLLYLNKPRTYTASLAIKMFNDSTSLSDWGALFAMSTLSLIPILLIFVFFQKYLVEGIATSGLKG
ncbi:MAG: carbohydrate ABC transporter permease [Lachnospiraceae bacterium]|nr:carbohydrate ABC transporter permease [Lachnospiraceae bacterium]